MEVEAAESPERISFYPRRPGFCSFGGDLGLNQSKRFTGVSRHGPILVRKEKTQTSESHPCQDLEQLSTSNSPNPIQRFTSARRDRSIQSAKPYKQPRLRSVLFREQEKEKRLPAKHEPINGKMMRLSEMFSTAATFLDDNRIPLVSANSYCVMLSNSKKVVLGSQIDTRRQVASLTKLMTALTVAHICKLYAVDMASTRIKIDSDSALMQGTTAGLKLGDELTVIDLLHGMLLPSGNDAATALSHHFGKFLSCMYSSQEHRPVATRFDSLKEFYDQHYKVDSTKLFMFIMNRLVGEIGMKNTHFENPTGLQHQKSYSTAYDMALLSTAFAGHPTLLAIVQKKNYHYTVYNNRLCTSKQHQQLCRPGVWKNTNHMLWRKRDCKGGKTGYTPWAGPCLSSMFKIKHMEFVVVLLRSATPEQRFIDAEHIYLWFKNKYFPN